MELFVLSLEFAHEGKNPTAVFSNLGEAKAERDRLNSAVSTHTERWIVERFTLDNRSDDTTMDRGV